MDIQVHFQDLVFVFVKINQKCASYRGGGGGGGGAKKLLRFG